MGTCGSSDGTTSREEELRGQIQSSRWKAKEKAEAAASAEATEATEAESRAQELQKQQAREGLRGGAPVDIKIVLLGAGESGKTTIFKNLQLIYGTRDFSKEGDWKLKIRTNMVYGIRSLCTAVVNLGLTGETDEAALQLMREVEEEDMEKMALECEDDVVSVRLSGLWRDPAIQAAWNRRSEFQINESHAVYFERIDELCAPSYEPSDGDILACRVLTTGIVDDRCEWDGARVRIFDVGGMRSERRNWIHLADDDALLCCVIFVAALSEYDQCCFEDSTVNRMVESLELFGQTCNGPFPGSSIILFLNKSDLFKAKVQHKAISSVPAFEDYSELYRPENDYDEGVAYFTWKFQEMVEDRQTKEVYTHVICATDTDAFTRTFDFVVKPMILEESMRNIFATNDFL